jgi:hypothetical protein
MLERPPGRRDRRREQQRRHRARLRHGRRVYPIELDGQILDMLVRLQWLPDSAAGDDREVARAVRALLTDIARRA